MKHAQELTTRMTLHFSENEHNIQHGQLIMSIVTMTALNMTALNMTALNSSLKADTLFQVKQM